MWCTLSLTFVCLPLYAYLVNMSEVQQVMGLVARLAAVTPAFAGDEATFLGWLLAVEARLLSTGVAVDEVKKGNKPSLTSGKKLKEGEINQLDASIFGFIVQSVSGLALTAIGHGPRSGSSALKTLVERYSPVGAEHVNVLKQQLRGVTFEPSDTANSFLTRVASLQAQIRHCGEEFSDDDLRQVISLALPPRFDLCMRLLMQQDPPPTLTKMTSDLLQEDRIRQRREATMGHQRKVEQAMAATSSTSLSRTRPSSGKCVNVTCVFCEKPGHCAQRCYKLESAIKHKLVNPAAVMQELRAHAKRNSKHTVYLSVKVSHLLDHTENNWVVDSGATAHMTWNETWFTHITSLPTGERSIVMADKSRIEVKGVGTIDVTFTNINNQHVHVTMQNVLYAPNLRFHLFSISAATKDKDHTVQLKDKDSCLFLASGDVIPFKRSEDGTLLLLPAEQASIKMSSQHTALQTHQEQHQLYGHKHQRAVQRIVGQQQQPAPVCEPCEYAKSKRSSISKQARPRQTKPIELLFGDLCGPIPHSRSYFTWVFAIIDDATRFAWTFLLRNKTDVYDAMEMMRTNRFVSGQLHGAMLQTDSEPLFKGDKFRTLCSDMTVTQRFSPPHTQAKNGIVERFFRTLFETVRALLFDSKLPQYFWEDAVRHATVLYNITPRAGEQQAPISKLYDRFRLPTLYTFGCAAYVNIPTQKQRKLEPRSRKGIYLGCDLEDSSHRVYVLSTNQVVNTVHVTFGEVEDWSSVFDPDDDESTSGTPFFNDTDWLDEQEFVHDEEQQQQQPQAIPVVTMDTSDDDPLLADDDDTCLVTFTDLPDPETIPQALNSPEAADWMDGIQQEFTAMETNNVFDIVSPVPKDVPVLSSKLVFRRKKDVNGRTVRYKVRWVAKGFTQTEGIDYHETFAPTTDVTSLRLLLALATSKGMILQQMDVDTAFLHADVDTDIYVRLPRGLDFLFPKNTVCKLNKSLYGLKQAPHLWYERLHTWFTQQGYTRLYSDLCVYCRRSEEGKMKGEAKQEHITWVTIYVDDLVIASSTPQAMETFKQEISREFKMKDMGEPSLCLGMKIKYDQQSKTTSISQHHYIQQMLSDFNMTDCKPARTPLPSNYTNIPLREDEEGGEEPFGTLVGKLLYAATCTRPDIAVAVSMLCGHMRKHSKQHWTAAKHVLRYLKGTSNATIQYNGTANAYLSAFSDASYATDPVKCRSRTGYVLFFASGPVSWHTKLQPTIATSSAEAEYMALTQTAKEIQYLRSFIEELTGSEILEPTTIHADNTASIKVATSSSTRMKHIKIRFHFIKQCIEEGTVTLQYCPTEHMTADILTKALGKDKQDKFRRALLNDSTTAHTFSSTTSTDI